MSGPASGNLFAALPAPGGPEAFETLAALPGVRVERITSHRHATPVGEWYNQNWDEWVLLISGSAALLVEGEGEARRLAPGDWVLLPRGLRHRVEETGDETVWLAVHVGEAGA